MQSTLVPVGFLLSVLDKWWNTFLEIKGLQWISLYPTLIPWASGDLSAKAHICHTSLILLALVSSAVRWRSWCIRWKPLSLLQSDEDLQCASLQPLYGLLKSFQLHFSHTSYFMLYTCHKYFHKVLGLANLFIYYTRKEVLAEGIPGHCMAVFLFLIHSHVQAEYIGQNLLAP